MTFAALTLAMVAAFAVGLAVDQARLGSGRLADVSPLHNAPRRRWPRGSEESAERERADEYAKEECDVTATVSTVAPA